MSDALRIQEETFHHECLYISHEFLEKAPIRLMVRDGPFVVLRGMTMDACYEIVEDDFLRLMVKVERVRLMPHPGT